MGSISREWHVGERERRTRLSSFSEKLGAVKMCGGRAGDDKWYFWPYLLIRSPFLTLKVPMGGHMKAQHVKPVENVQKI